MKSIKKTADLSSQSPLLSSVAEYLSDHAVPDTARILVAFSGGPDSTALAGALRELRPETVLALAYLDHGIRSGDERALDLAFAEEFASAIGCRLIRGSITPGRIAEESESAGMSREDTARRLRYDFLDSEARAYNARFIALGHTLDDQAETVIMRVFQGSGPGGLSGIPERRGMYIRPLIRCTRAHVLEYLSARGYGFRTDSSNLEPEYLRNRVRLFLLPVVKELFPGFLGTLKAFTGRMAELNEYLNTEAGTVIPWERIGRSYKTDAAAFRNAPVPLRIQSVYNIYHSVTGRTDFRLPARFLKPLFRNREPGRDCVIVRGYGFLLRTVGNSIFAEQDIVQKPETGYSVQLDIEESESTCSIPDMMDITVGTSRSDSFEGDFPWVIQDSLTPPVFLRSRKPGDVLQTRNGRKSVVKLLSEWKIPVSLRPFIPVLEDRLGIIGVLGSPFGYRNRFTERCTEHRLPDKIIVYFSIHIYGV